jgi:hypothetical protein
MLDNQQLNNEVLKNIKITSQEHMIIKSMEKFYEDDKNINMFINIINSNTSISIRLIDHFVTKYSKINKVSYKLYENGEKNLFVVFTSYKQQLKAFQKKHFDPFSRGERIPYFMGTTCVITTIGQLNFFRWFISKNIINYVNQEHNNIENDMNRRNNNDNKLKKDKVKKDKKLYQKYTPYNITKPATVIEINAIENKKTNIMVTFF